MKWLVLDFNKSSLYHQDIINIQKKLFFYKINNIGWLAIKFKETIFTGEVVEELNFLGMSEVVLILYKITGNYKAKFF